MSRYSQRTLWPIVVLAGCLGVSSILATLAWRQSEPPPGEGAQSARSDGIDQVERVAKSSSSKGGNRREPSVFATFPSRPERAAVAPPVAKRAASAPPTFGPLSPTAPSNAPLVGTSTGYPSTAPSKWPSAAPRDVVANGQDAAEQASPTRTTFPSPPRQASLWPYPTALVNTLRGAPAPAASWADGIQRQLEYLHEINSLGAEQARQCLAKLRTLAEEGVVVEETLRDHGSRVWVQRTLYALARRLDVWERVNAAVAVDSETVESRSIDAMDSNQQMLLALKEIANKLRVSADSETWRSYLLLDSLQQEALAEVDIARRSELAQRVLRRMHAPALSRGHVALFTKFPFTDFGAALRGWVASPIDYPHLLDQLELVESRGGAAAASELAETTQRLFWSSNDAEHALGDRLVGHYRNANIRSAISVYLINRLLPGERRFVGDVDDEILGSTVLGRSETLSLLRVVLLPDRQQWRLGLEARGMVASETETYSGPATFYNEGAARYVARKLLLVDERGVRVRRAEADANNQTELLDISTSFDGIPLLENVARSVAEQQYYEAAGEAQLEAESRVTSKVQSQLDSEVEQRLRLAERDFKRRVVAPLRRLNLDPTPVQLYTTRQRLVSRFRLASEEQLAANTPRPLAPSNSWFSMQIHQSAANNIIEQLDLDGRETSLGPLYQRLAGVLGQTDAKLPEDLPGDVRLRFAEQDAVSLEFGEGRVLLTIRLAEMEVSKRRKWRNFVVRTEYRPVIEGRQARLVRQGHIELRGRRLSLLDQVALRGIFIKVLSTERALPLVEKRLAAHPRLADLFVSQCVIEDGWIGLALSPVGRARFSKKPQDAARR